MHCHNHDFKTVHWIHIRKHLKILSAFLWLHTMPVVSKRTKTQSRMNSSQRFQRCSRFFLNRIFPSVAQPPVEAAYMVIPRTHSSHYDIKSATDIVYASEYELSTERCAIISLITFRICSIRATVELFSPSLIPLHLNLKINYYQSRLLASSINLHICILSYQY